MIDLVWDGRGRATIKTPSGHQLTAGSPDVPSAEDLMAAAAAVSLMEGYLRAAAEAGRAPLGYASAAAVRQADDGPQVAVRILVSCRTTDDRRVARQIIDKAQSAAGIAGLLRDRLQVEFEAWTPAEGVAP